MAYSGMKKKYVDFKYSYRDPSGVDAFTKIEVEIPYEEIFLEDLITEVLKQMDPMIKYLDESESIKIILIGFIRQENQKYWDEFADQTILAGPIDETDVESIIRETERNYKVELIQFADRIGPTDEDIFAQSYHKLVHSSSLEDVLNRERSYAAVISGLTKEMDTKIEELCTKQEAEMESHINQLDITTTSEDINNLLLDQCNTQNYIRKRYESELEAIKGHQKNEYRRWITKQVSKVFENSPVATPVGNRSSMFVSQQPSMEESFTIHLGLQMKHMHNIRILSANITDLCSPLHADENLNGLNMAMGLYSSSLSGVVVLTPSIQAQPNKSIVKNAQMSTEFHFDQIDDQLQKIEQEIKSITLNASTTNSTGNGETVSSSPMKTTTKLQTGDFFITKHSNLSQSHVIFHLFSDEPINSPSEISSRHPVILGLRNILKTANRHDVTTLTIPALLRHEMSEDMTVQWCMRRAELVFKCAKGFMIESASWGGAELSTLQLLLPHDISEELFTTLAGMVPNVFRESNPKILVPNTDKPAG